MSESWNVRIISGHPSAPGGFVVAFRPASTPSPLHRLRAEVREEFHERILPPAIEALPELEHYRCEQTRVADAEGELQRAELAIERAQLDRREVAALKLSSLELATRLHEIKEAEAEAATTAELYRGLVAELSQTLAEARTAAAEAIRATHHKTWSEYRAECRDRSQKAKAALLDEGLLTRLEDIVKAGMGVDNGLLGPSVLMQVQQRYLDAAAQPVAEA